MPQFLFIEFQCVQYYRFLIFFACADSTYKWFNHKAAQKDKPILSVLSLNNLILSTFAVPATQQKVQKLTDTILFIDSAIIWLMIPLSLSESF